MASVRAFPNSYDGTAIKDKYTFGYDVKTPTMGNGSGTIKNG